MMRIRHQILLLLALLGTCAASAADIKTISTVDFNTCNKPEWPKEALRNEVTGTVRLRFLINEEGTVIDSIVQSSSGSPLLDDAALSAIQHCKFKPPTVNGITTSGWTSIQYVWTLETDEGTRLAIAEAVSNRTAALAGNGGALFKLAHFFRDGIGGQPDKNRYEQLLRASAERAYPEAEFELAAAFYYGQFAAKDMVQAIAWYQRAASHGDAPGQFWLGNFYESGNGVERDLPQAVLWYRKAADQGNHEAEKALGRMLETGDGVAQNNAEAAIWYRKAAESGNAEACYHLGALYLRGLGVPGDTAQAMLWLGKAVEQRQEMAEAALANMYFSGTGVVQSDTEGIKYLRRAALAGNAQAMRQLGLMLSQGLRVKADSQEGKLWLSKAARLGVSATPVEVVRFDL